MLQFRTKLSLPIQNYAKKLTRAIDSFIFHHLNALSIEIASSMLASVSIYELYKSAYIQILNLRAVAWSSGYERRHVLKAVGLNPNTVYWMDNFLHKFVVKLYCSWLEKAENK